MRLVGSAIIIAVAILGFAAIAQQTGTGGNQSPAGSPPAPIPPTNAPPTSAPPTNGSSSQTPSQPQVDESALRYFASQGDTRRVNAEIARLRALYPNWNPPSDLSQLSGSPGAPPPDPLIERLWNLYREDRIAEVRAAIAERQAADSNWKPPEELVTALETVEARRRVTNASDTGQWRTVLSVATETPGLLTCMNVDVLWRVAEAFARTDQQSRSRDVYTYILTNCANPAERLATLQKALLALPEPQVTALLQFERRTGDTPDDFGSIRDELARRRVERASLDSKMTASADDLAVVERMIQTSGEAGPVLILGWYNYHHGNPARALELFKTALDRNAGPKAAEGYAMTLRALNRLAEAEAFAYEWRERAPENMKIYLDVATALLSQDPPPRLDTQVIGRIVPVVMAQRFSDAAQALGWYSYNTEQIRTARDWFRTALSWKADDEPSAYGLALSTQRLNDRGGFNAVVAQWRSRSQRIADLADGVNPATRQTVVAQPAIPQPVMTAPPAMAAPPPMAAPVETAPPAQPRYAPREVAVERVETEQAFVRTEDNVRRRQSQARSALGRSCAITRNPNGLSADAALTRGWCLMEANRPLEAVDAFDRAISNGSNRTREEAAYGKSLAYLRKNLTSEAAIAAAEAPQTRERQVELGASILTQRALAAYRDGRFVETLHALSERARLVPEQNDLLLIRAWSYLKLGRFNDAEKIFRAVQQTGYSEEAAAGLNAILELTGQMRY